MSPLSIGQGFVFHSRKEGFANAFRYPTFYLHMNCSEEQGLRQIFRKQFYKLLSISAKDYLQGRAGSLDQNIKSFLRESVNYEAEEVWLQTMPKMFGYVFNPVSFWFCRSKGQIEAVLVEVNNTFGERHFYWIHPPLGTLQKQWLRAEKVFHVSPFFPVEGYYQFRFQMDAPSPRVDINYHAADGKLRLATWVQGQLSPLDTHSLFSILRKYGWITPLVVFRIHYQALKLWFARTRFHRKPLPPSQEVSQ